MTDEKGLGQIAYEAYEDYLQSTGSKPYDDRDCPAWHELSDRVRAAWYRAAWAATDEYLAREDAGEMTL